MEIKGSSITKLSNVSFLWHCRRREHREGLWNSSDVHCDCAESRPEERRRCGRCSAQTIEKRTTTHIHMQTHTHAQTMYKSWSFFTVQEPLFPARVVYDLLFYFVVIIIVLNLIFGVIIDTFADLRSEKQKKEEVLKTTCFICCKTSVNRFWYCGCLCLCICSPWLKFNF